MFRRRSRILPIGIVLVAVLALTHTYWLTALGRFLIDADPPGPADVAVVLGGGTDGGRILYAGELVRKGLVKKVLVSDNDGFYGVSEAELAIDFAVRHGYPREYFVKSVHRMRFTRQEAEQLVPEVRGMNARSFLVVTSDYHTRRARRLFRKTSQGLDMKVVAAPDTEFQYDRWWTNRDGQKVFFLEWTKNIATAFGI